jgi:hypothetical protein
MTKALPKTLFVKTEKDHGTEYFVADTSAHVLVEMGQRVKIGVYQLVEINNYEGVATKLKR